VGGGGQGGQGWREGERTGTMGLENYEKHFQNLKKPVKNKDFDFYL
jgi:hypothetical protein